MRIRKIIVPLLLVIVLLGFSRAYAYSLSDLLNAGSNSSNQDIKDAASKISEAYQDYQKAQSVKTQIQNIKTSDDAFAILEQNSETLGISSMDLATLKTAYTNGEQAWDANSRLTKTVKQIIANPKTISSSTISQAKTDIETLINSIEAIKTAANNLSTNSTGNTGKNIGDDTAEAADKATSAAQNLQEALNSGDNAAAQQAASSLQASLNNLANINSASGLASRVQTTNTSGSTAQDYIMGIKNWEGQQSEIINSSGQGVVDDIQTDICDNLFADDQQNLFKDVTCSLIKVVAASTAQLSTQMTCTIQQSGANTNYLSDITFTSDQGICAARTTNQLITSTESNYIYGLTDSTSQPDSGFYAGSVSSLTSDLGNSSGSTNQTYQIIKWILSVIALIGLFIFAFANILNIEINTYAIKKAIPKVVVALVGGWLSLTIVILLSRTVDIAYQLNIFSPYQSLHPMNNIFLGNFNLSSATNTMTDLTRGISVISALGSQFLGNGASFSGMFVGSFFLTIPALTVIIFEYVLAIRPFVVQLLAAAGPLAFACIILPQTQYLFRKWWTYLIIAFSYPLAVNFVFFFLNKIDTNTGGNAGFFALWAFKIFIIAMLIRMPFAIQSDIKKISEKVSKSGFLSSLGLGKLFKTQQPPATSGGSQTDNNLSSKKARGLVAPIASRAFGRNITGEPTEGSLSRGISSTPSLQSMSSVPPSLAGIILNAHKTNLSRSTDIMKNSIQDIPGTVMRAVVDRDDLQLWRDTRLIEQLKNKEGQLLDDQGAAIRADSIRKVRRLAEVSSNGKLTNGDLVKFLASKSMLSALPAEVVKEAVNENIINNADLIASYGSGYQKILNSPGRNLEGAQQIKSLINRDQMDYLTGYTQIGTKIAAAFNAGVDPKQSAGEITQEIVRGGSGNLMKNSDYYLERISGDNKAAIASLAESLSKSGVDKRTASSLAQNGSIGFEQISRYIPKQHQNPNSLQEIKEGLFNRDTTSSLANEIGNIVVQEKTSTSRAITGKIADTFRKNDETSIAGVQEDIKGMIDKLEGPASPQEIEEIAKKIGQYHPGTKIKTNQKYDQNDVEQIRQKAEEVLETTEKISESGFNEKKVAEDTVNVSKSVENSIASDIRNKARGSIAKDSDFIDKLGSISRVIKNNGR